MGECEEGKGSVRDVKLGTNNVDAARESEKQEQSNVRLALRSGHVALVVLRIVVSVNSVGRVGGSLGVGGMCLSACCLVS